ncbi:MAG: hypothetical protein WCH65_04260 [bacterium]
MKTNILVAAIIIFILASCGNTQTKTQQTKTIVGKDGKEYVVAGSISQYSPTIEEGKITPFGNGMYYFGFVEDNFGKQLSLFIDQHPELRMVSFTTNDRKNGFTIGYFVKFEPVVNPCPCDTIKTVKKLI